MELSVIEVKAIIDKLPDVDEYPNPEIFIPIPTFFDIDRVDVCSSASIKTNVLEFVKKKSGYIYSWHLVLNNIIE